MRYDLCGLNIFSSPDQGSWPHHHHRCLHHWRPQPRCPPPWLSGHGRVVSPLSSHKSVRRIMKLFELPNGKASTVNRALDGCTYPSLKLVPSSLCKKIVSCMKCNNLYSGLVMPSSGWWSPITLSVVTLSVIVLKGWYFCMLARFKSCWVSMLKQGKLSRLIFSKVKSLVH